MEQKNVFHYHALQYLESDSNRIEECIQDIKDNMYNVDVNLVLYEVNQESQYKPFLRFLLEKDFQDELQIPKINPLLLLMNQKPFFEYLSDFLNVLIVSSNNIIENSLNYECKGMIQRESSIYLFIDITYSRLVIADTYRSSPLWFTLVDEIMNIQHVCNMKIHKDVTKLFTVYPEFLFLENEKKEAIEIPIVVYVGRPENKLEFTYVFGVTKTESTNHLHCGSYYYFTNFENALEQIKTEENISNRKGIVRIAIFLGKLLVEENENSSKDEYEMWTEKYDSVYLGKKEDKFSFYYVVKEFEQQQPLSFHYLDKTGTFIL
jgi:hypothetical protein